jgi:hypothetical protein
MQKYNDANAPIICRVVPVDAAGAKLEAPLAVTFDDWPKVNVQSTRHRLAMPHQ